MGSKWLEFATFVFTGGFLLNWVWEVAQLPLYAGYQRVAWYLDFLHCLPATLLDALFITGLYFTGRAGWRDAHWPEKLNPLRCLALALAGFGVAVKAEKLALGLGWWRYAGKMPMIPLLEVGLSPVTQLTLLSPLTFVLAGKFATVGKEGHEELD